jgi:hypothetical protein
MFNFRKFFSEKYTFFEKIAYPILRKMCFLQQKSGKMKHGSLSKTGVIETIFGYIKENFNLKPSKHRSPINFFISLLAALIAFQLKPNKPTISYP